MATSVREWVSSDEIDFGVYAVVEDDDDDDDEEEEA